MTDNATAASVAVLMVGFVGGLGAAFWTAPRAPAALPTPPHHEAEAPDDPTVTLCDAIVARAGARAALSRATGIPVPTNLHPRGCPNEDQ